MPEFKLVVSDPEAGNAKPIPVIVEGSDELEYGEEHKEGRKTIEVKVNGRTLELIKAPYGFATLRLFKEGAENQKINVTVKVVKDDNVPELVVQAPVAFLEDKIGQDKAFGEIVRAKAFQITVSGNKASLFLDKKIGDVVDASPLGFSGRKLLITGGSDNTGFPMLKTLPGGGKKKLLLSSPPGFHPRVKGERRRKFVRGNMITDEIVQINTKLIIQE